MCREKNSSLHIWCCRLGLPLAQRPCANTCGSACPTTWCRLRLSSIPSLPVTEQGKVNRAACPRERNRLTDEAYVEPRTLVEEELVTILAPLLKVDRVGVNDNFFLLGGHSLLGTQVITRVSENFGVELTLLRLFDHPTVAEMSAEIECLIMAKVENEAKTGQPGEHGTSV